MSIFNNILEAAGNTPLVKLNSIPSDLNADIYVKVEYMNPGGSVKDRVAFHMVQEAEKAGLLKPGGTIIEATAGNTGVGLAIAAAVKKYRAIFVMPDKMSLDKVNLLKAFGAEVVITPTSVAPDSPESYNGVADRLTREIPGAFRPNQFGNMNNPEAHYMTTGPEIWEAIGDKIDVFVAGMGTGGTISGTGRYLKEKKSSITVIGADPEGSILSGDSPHSYKVEGIGEDFIPVTFDRQVVDEMVRVSDKESFNTARRLAREEGILAGGSSGTALAAAVKYARRFTSRKTMVVLLPDTGRNYLSKIFSDSWMQENGYWEGEPVKRYALRDVVVEKKGIITLVSVSPDHTISEALSLMHQYDISQMPVVDNGRVAGSLNEISVLKQLHAGADINGLKVSSVMGRPFLEVDGGTDVSEAYRLLLAGHNAIIVTEKNRIDSIITKMDIIDFFAGQKTGTAKGEVTA